MKKNTLKSVLAAIIMLSVPLASASIEIATLTTENSGFSLVATSTDVSGLETLKITNASETGLNTYIQQVGIHCPTTASVTLGWRMATSTHDASNTGRAIFGPINFNSTTASTTFIRYTFIQPLRLPTNASLTVDSNVAGSVMILISGRVK